MAKPKPVPKQVVCSVCDLPWDEHTKGRKTEPTADVCIRLLKAELAKARLRPYFSGTSSATNVVPFKTLPFHVSAVGQ